MASCPEREVDTHHMMECQRLTLPLALGHIAESVGYENLFMQCFRA